MIEKSDKALPSYILLENKLQELELFESLYLGMFQSESCYKRRHWFSNLQLKCPVAMMTRQYGGNIGNINIMCNATENEVNLETLMARVVLKANQNFPEYHTRQMRKDFIQTYRQLVKSSKCVLHDIYQESSGDTNALLKENERLMQERIAKFILTSDDPEIIIDLEKTNGVKEHSNFNEFWDKINQLFKEYQTPVHKRRHGTYHYLPFAISTRELIEQVKRQKPGITTPSEEWVRLHFTLKNPYTT